MAGSNEPNPYARLAIMMALSFVAMFVLMYAMVDRMENVYANVNQVYMAGLMTAAMLAIEMIFMGAMYHDKRLNRVIGATAFAALVGFWALTRAQAAVSDKQFLRSMIPHHAGAILMCEKAPIQDAEIKRLCRNIIDSQQSEIRQMKAMLKRPGLRSDVSPHDSSLP